MAEFEEMLPHWKDTVRGYLAEQNTPCTDSPQQPERGFSVEWEGLEVNGASRDRRTLTLRPGKSGPIVWLALDRATTDRKALDIHVTNDEVHTALVWAIGGTYKHQPDEPPFPHTWHNNELWSNKAREYPIGLP
jgi:hypothetical protein